MIGTIVNSLAILAGTGLGLLFKKQIKKEIWDSVLRALGIIILAFGLLGIFNAFEFADGRQLNTRFELLLILAIALGTFLGGVLKIDLGLQKFGTFLEKRFNKGSFSEGFINASLIFCVGAMAVVGAVNDALGDPTLLYLKAILDGITSMVLAATFGYGVLLSAGSVLIYQGIISGLAFFLGDFLSEEFVQAFGMVGSAIVAAIGINFLSPNKIKTANMLPALGITILYYLFALLW